MTKVIGQKGPGQYGYKAFTGYGQEFEVWAPSMNDAKKAVIAEAKIPMSRWSGIGIILCERPDGSVVTHSGTEF